MFNAASLIKSLVLALATILLVYLYSWFNMFWWQQALQQKLEHLALHSPSKDHNNQQQALLISATTLPPAPKHTVAPLAMVPRLENTTVKEQQHLAPNTNSVSIKPLEIAETKNQSAAIKPSSQVAKQQVSAKQIYEQLQGDNTLDVQIALPASAAKQQQLFDYLYRCAGVQFAVLQQQQLRYLSPQRYVTVSQWLRVANGPLGAQEQDWLGQQTGTPIRIFPQAIDQRLAQYIASSLGGAKLSSVRASYELTAAGLGLNNIQLNNHSTHDAWLLHRSQCTI